VHLVVYGDFNCPFSALASSRVERLEGAGIVNVEWRAVEHAPDIPRSGEPVRGHLADELDRELDQVHELLCTGEDLALHRPRSRSNTGAAVATYAGSDPRVRSAVRVELFRRYWVDGQDLGDDRLLVEVGGARRATVTSMQWRREWLDLDRPVVPMMRLPDGYVSRGLGALARLAELLDATSGRSLPRPFDGAAACDADREHVSNQGDIDEDS
jgi:DSBA-like thioredoxin domain